MRFFGHVGMDEHAHYHCQHVAFYVLLVDKQAGGVLFQLGSAHKPMRVSWQIACLGCELL